MYRLGVNMKAERCRRTLRLTCRLGHMYRLGVDTKAEGVYKKVEAYLQAAA